MPVMPYDEYLQRGRYRCVRVIRERRGYRYTPSTRIYLESLKRSFSCGVRGVERGVSYGLSLLLL